MARGNFLGVFWSFYFVGDWWSVWLIVFDFGETVDLDFSHSFWKISQLKEIQISIVLSPFASGYL